MTDPDVASVCAELVALSRRLLNGWDVTAEELDAFKARLDTVVKDPVDDDPTGLPVFLSPPDIEAAVAARRRVAHLSQSAPLLEHDDGT